MSKHLITDPDEILNLLMEDPAFTESESLLNAFNYESDAGYPREIAITRAFDYLFAGRRTTV